MSIDDHHLHTHRILEQLQACDSISQRSLSRDLGIALGLANRLLRRMVKCGWVEVVRQSPNRVRYVTTAAGIEQAAIMSCDYFEDAVGRYREMRGRIAESLRLVSGDWPVGAPEANREKRVVFYGTGEVAEIAFVSLQESDLRLVGVVDQRSSGRFFGLPVRPVECLTTTALDGVPFDRLIVTSFDGTRRLPAQLAARGFLRERVGWL